MKRIEIALLAVLTAVGASSCGQSQQGQDASADEQRITEVGDREIGAVTAADVETNLATLTDDIVMMAPDVPTMVGKDAVRSWLQRTHGEFDLDVRYTASEVEVLGDWAVQRYTNKGTITPKTGGPPQQMSGKGIHIFRRQPDGSWLIAQDIWNYDPIEPAKDEST